MQLNISINHPGYLAGKESKQNNQAIIANRVREAIVQSKLSSNDYTMNATKSANMVISALIRFCIRAASGIRSKRFKHTKKAGSKQPSKSDGSDPDPETLFAYQKSLSSLVQSVNSMLQTVFFARTSVSEVAK